MSTPELRPVCFDLQDVVEIRAYPVTEHPAPSVGGFSTRVLRIRNAEGVVIELTLFSRWDPDACEDANGFLEIRT